MEKLTLPKGKVVGSSPTGSANLLGDSMPTPCEERGWKVGDRFIYREVKDDNNNFGEWSEVELELDDGTDCPLFALVYGTCLHTNSRTHDRGAYDWLSNFTPADDGIRAIAKAMRNLQQQ